MTNPARNRLCLTLSASLAAAAALFVSAGDSPAANAAPAPIFTQTVPGGVPRVTPPPAYTRPLRSGEGTARPVQRTTVPVGRPYRGPVLPGTAPAVTGLHLDSNGRVSGYHVVSPAVVENPFAIFPQGRTAVASPYYVETAPVSVFAVREAVALPSALVCEQREQAQLELRLADPELVRPTVFCTEEQFRREALPLVRSQYRASPKGLVPVCEYEVSTEGVVRKRVRSETNAYAQPTDAAILAAFRAGAAFVVSRRRTIPLVCGMCEGAGAVVKERLVTGGTVTQTVTASCPRCGGDGRVERHVDALFTLQRKPEPKALP